MRSVCLFVAIAALACLSVCQADHLKANPASEPYNYCVKCSEPVTNCTAELLKGDWLVVYSSDIRYRKGASYWGGDFHYDFCDPLNLNRGCMAVGYTNCKTDGNKTIGYTYSFNAFTEVWTIEQFTTTLVTVPGTSFSGYRTNYQHYIQVEDKTLFADQKVTACGNKVLRSGPIYRSTNYVILAQAADNSWAVHLYCDSFYGFVDRSAPLIQVVVRREALDKVSYPFNTNYFYKEVRAAIIKNKLDIYVTDLDLVYHDQAALYPTAVAWDSVQWEADCVCNVY